MGANQTNQAESVWAAASHRMEEEEEEEERNSKKTQTNEYNTKFVPITKPHWPFLLKTVTHMNKSKDLKITQG